MVAVSKSFDSYNLILQNMGLIKKCVSQIRYSNLDFEDLVQEAVLMLLPKIEAYDSSRGALSTFIWVNVKRNLANKTQAVSEHLYKISLKIKNAEKYLIAQGKDSSCENIAEFLGLSTEACEKYIAQINSAKLLSLDECYADDDSESFCNNFMDTRYVDPEKNAIDCSLKQQLTKAVRNLPENQRLIISLRYNLNNSSDGCLSLRQIGKLLNVSAQTVANIEAKGLQNLKGQLEGRAA